VEASLDLICSTFLLLFLSYIFTGHEPPNKMGRCLCIVNSKACKEAIVTYLKIIYLYTLDQ
jgi:hypothetical protein